jgi:hypothetical protein
MANHRVTESDRSARRGLAMYTSRLPVPESVVRRIVLVLLLSLLLAPLASAQEFSSLEERMSAADFRAAGLDKLSDEELARLNEWLRRNGPRGASATLAPQGPPIYRRGMFEKADAIHSRLVGDYNGQSGKGTRFELENGQVWEVSDSGSRLATQRMSRPAVTVEPGLLGAWYLRLDEFNGRVSVRRIR